MQQQSGTTPSLPGVYQPPAMTQPSAGPYGPRLTDMTRPNISFPFITPGSAALSPFPGARLTQPGMATDMPFEAMMKQHRGQL